MQYTPTDVLIKNGGSIYKLVVLASMRAIELSEGAAKLVDAPVGMKPTVLAIKEIREGKISYKEKDKK